MTIAVEVWLSSVFRQGYFHRKICGLFLGKSYNYKFAMEAMVGNGDEDWAAAFLALGENKLIYRVRNNIYRTAFFKHFTDKNANILDVGCGNGDFVRFLRSEGFTSVYGVDPSHVLRGVGGELDFIKMGTATALPFEQGTFVGIYLFNVLHHLKSAKEYSQAFAEFSRCLTKDGVLLVIEPCNRLIFGGLFAVSRLLSPFFSFAVNYQKLLSDEWVDLSYFFRNSHLIENEISSSFGFKVIYNKRKFHQWIIAFTKS